MSATLTVLYPLQVWGENQSADPVVHVLGVAEGVYCMQTAGLRCIHMYQHRPISKNGFNQLSPFCS